MTTKFSSYLSEETPLKPFSVLIKVDGSLYCSEVLAKSVAQAKQTANLRIAEKHLNLDRAMKGIPVIKAKFKQSNPTYFVNDEIKDEDWNKATYVGNHSKRGVIREDYELEAMVEAVFKDAPGIYRNIGLDELMSQLKLHGMKDPSAHDMKLKFYYEKYKKKAEKKLKAAKA